MATWSPTLFLVLLLLPPCLLPSAVHCEPITSSDEVVRDFPCNNPDVQESVFPTPCPNKTKTLYIQGFIPATNPVYEAEAVIPAAYMAIDDVNANCSMIPGYKLQLDWVNTLCDPAVATWQLMDSLILQQNDSDPLRKVTFLDGGCSLATETLAALSGKFYLIPMITCVASSPLLSQRNLFPRFMRTIPSEAQSNKARFALMQKYNWSRVATLYELPPLFAKTADDFSVRYDVLYNKSSDSGSDDSEEDHVRRSFTDDPKIPLEQILEKDIRIIFGLFYEDKALITICLAYHMGLTTANHLWILPSWYNIDWWDKEVPLANMTCTRQQMRQAVNNSLLLDSYNFGFDKDERTDTPTESASVFEEKYQCYLEEFRANPVSGRITDDDAEGHFFCYDAVWTIALGLDETDRALKHRRGEEPGFNLTLDDFRYFNETPVSTMISDFMINASFTGISGKVRFDENGSRAGLNAVYQLRENLTTDTLDLVLVAIHDPGIESADNRDFNRNLTFIVEPLWKGDGPPRDRRTPRNIYMNQQLVYACYFITSVAIVIGIALLIFNLVTMFKPLIRDSAPHMNTIIIIGCIWILATCYLLSVDSANPPIDEFVDDPSYIETDDVAEIRNHRYKVICTLRLWFLTIGFTLSFGALFAKTWQVYGVYANPKLQKKPFKMRNFFIIIGIFLVIDLAYLIFWTAVYPFHRNLEMQTDDSADIERIHEECECDNFVYLIGALYVYKGLLVVCGLFLAYESRNVKYYYINDSRFVSIAMYIVVILIGIGAPLTLVLAVHFFTDAAYGLAVFMVIASALSCMLIIFVPKFVFMAHGKNTMVREEITVSDGLQLGHTTVDQTDVNTVEGEVDKLKLQNEKNGLKLRELQSETAAEGDLGGLKPHTSSNGDSGVVDKNNISPEFTTNREAHCSAIKTPSSSGIAP